MDGLPIASHAAATAIPGRKALLMLRITGDRIFDLREMRELRFAEVVSVPPRLTVPSVSSRALHYAHVETTISQRVGVDWGRCDARRLRRTAGARGP